MECPREGQSATLLKNGEVLMHGGHMGGEMDAPCPYDELYIRRRDSSSRFRVHRRDAIIARALTIMPKLSIRGAGWGTADIRKASIS